VVADLEGNRQKVVNLLQEVGLHRAEAKCLGQLMYGNEVTSRQIEHDTYLRQSEVSVTMTRFKSRGWIRERNDNCTSGKGRPTKYYTLNVPIESIIVMIETDFNEKVKTKSEMFKMLKTLID
jgi:predicted transcriptional regulator